MSWKMFWQIVLLMVIGTLILSVFKCGLLQYKRGCMGKYFGDYRPPRGMQK